GGSSHLRKRLLLLSAPATFSGHSAGSSPWKWRSDSPLGAGRAGERKAGDYFVSGVGDGAEAAVSEEVDAEMRVFSTHSTASSTRTSPASRTNSSRGGRYAHGNSLVGTARRLEALGEADALAEDGDYGGRPTAERSRASSPTACSWALGSRACAQTRSI